MRDGMGQSQRSRTEGAVDTVITNALILDHWGIVRQISPSKTAVLQPSAKLEIRISNRMSRSSSALEPK